MREEIISRQLSLLRFPEEILEMILKNLSNEELAKSRLVSKTFNRIIIGLFAWKRNACKKRLNEDEEEIHNLLLTNYKYKNWNVHYDLKLFVLKMRVTFMVFLNHTFYPIKIIEEYIFLMELIRKEPPIIPAYCYHYPKIEFYERVLKFEYLVSQANKHFVTEIVPLVPSIEVFAHPYYTSKCEKIPDKLLEIFDSIYKASKRILEIYPQIEPAGKLHDAFKYDPSSGRIYYKAHLDLLVKNSCLQGKRNLLYERLVCVKRKN